MTLIAYILPKLQTGKDVVRQMSKKSHFIRPYDKQHVKRSQTYKSRQQHLYNDWSIWRQLSWKKSVLAISKLLGLFVNTLTADDKYSLLNRENLTQPIRTQLSKKQLFLICFSNFSNVDHTFNIFKNKVNLIADVLTKLRTPKGMVR